MLLKVKRIGAPLGSLTWAMPDQKEVNKEGKRKGVYHRFPSGDVKI
jgi:hypothetical protein